MGALDTFRPVRKNPGNGLLIIAWHYSCNPRHDPTTEHGREWKRNTKKGMSERQWQREHELNYSAAAGEAVYPAFDSDYHIREIVPFEGDFLYRAWDPAYRASACVWWGFKEFPEGIQIRIYDEQEVLSSAFTGLVKDALIREKETFANWTGQIIDDVDIAGKQHHPDGSTPVQIMNNLGIYPNSKRSYPTDRIEMITHFVAKRDKDKEPGLLVHPRCRRLISGFEGLYRWPEKKEGKPAPKKPAETEVIHAHQSFEYGVWNNVHLKVTEAQERAVKLKKESLIDWMLREAAKGREPDADEI